MLSCQAKFWRIILERFFSQEINKLVQEPSILMSGTISSERKLKMVTSFVRYVNTLKNPADILSENVTQKIHDSHAHKMLNGTMDCWNEESDKNLELFELLLLV